MQNCHGRTVLDFLMDYWTISNFMLKFHSTCKMQMFYLLLNYMGEYIHLLIKPVLNAITLSYLEIHVTAVTVNHWKLIRSVKPNCCRFSQLCYTFTGHKLNTVYYVSLFTSRLSCFGVTMATIYVYAIGSVYFRSACWHLLAYDVIIMQFTVMMIRRLFLIFHLHNITILKSGYEDSDSDSDSKVWGLLSEASSVSSYPFRKNDKGTKNVVERKDVLDTQQLE